MPKYVRRPEWLKPLPLNPAVLVEMGRLMRGLKLHNLCDSAECPNRTRCFAEGTATFMILGDICTRNCTFCAVTKGTPLPPDPEQPEHVVAAVRKLGLRYVVVTSVTRDDLPDGGASHFAQTVEAIHNYDPDIMVEVLIPDFRGSLPALQTVIDAHPAVLNHNVETVPRLYHEVRPKANYQQSIELLKQAKLANNRLFTKSGLMLGLGETQQEVIEVMTDLRQANCDLLTLGQYLQPSLKHHRVVRYVPPEEFEEYQNLGKEMGFISVFSGPLVRSSFHAAEAYLLATTETAA
jgi:lipoic acid synthetase